MIDLDGQPQLGKLSFSFGNLLLVAGDGNNVGPRPRQLACGCTTNAGGGSGHQHYLSLDPTTQGAIDEEFGVEVALPVVPQPPGVAVQRRHFDTGPFQYPLGFATVETGGIADKAEHILGQTQIGDGGIADAAHRRHGHQHGGQVAGNKIKERGVDADRGLRRMGGAGEGAQHVANPHRVGVG